MAGDEFGERTEQPTERRRSEARQKGNVARSTDLNSAGLMLAAAIALYTFGLSLTESLGELAQDFLGGPAWQNIDGARVTKQAWDLAETLASAVLPLMAVMVGAALFFNVVQVGVLITPESLQPKLSRMSPISGVKRILSVRALVKLAVSLGKLAMLVAIAGWFISAALPHFLNVLGVGWMDDPSASAHGLARDRQLAALIVYDLREHMARLAFWLALALVVLALLDFAFQKWKHEQDLRMTKQEVREEMKNMEGDPQLRQRRRDAHRKLAQARELQEVSNADVVVTNPMRIAIALKYDPETMPAPTVVAKGRGEIAARIRQIATEHGIPVIERKPLAQALDRDVRVGHTIPVEMYEVFVEIMAYVYRVSGRTPPNLS